MSFFITFIKIIIVTLFVSSVCRAILFPIQFELKRIADFLSSFEVTVEEKEIDGEQ